MTADRVNLYAQPTQTLKSLFKKAAYSIAPHAATAVLSSRARAYSHRLVKEWGLFDINQKLIREVGNRVLFGPFRGMILAPMAQQANVGPYLLGTYEMELHAWWEQVFQGVFGQVIDIGANFGYYAIGLAQRFPNAAHVAFDTDWWARNAIREMASTNRVGGICVRSFCNPPWLMKNLRDCALIVRDCEGYERELFCTTDVSALESATLIIELHESISPGVSAEISDRFGRTHVVREIGSRSETPIPQVSVPSLTKEELCRALQEVRPQQTWMFLLPRSAGRRPGDPGEMRVPTAPGFSSTSSKH